MVIFLTEKDSKTFKITWVLSKLSQPTYLDCLYMEAFHDNTGNT